MTSAISSALHAAYRLPDRRVYAFAVDFILIHPRGRHPCTAAAAIPCQDSSGLNPTAVHHAGRTNKKRQTPDSGAYLLCV